MLVLVYIVGAFLSVAIIAIIELLHYSPKDDFEQKPIKKEQDNSSINTTSGPTDTELEDKIERSVL